MGGVCIYKNMCIYIYIYMQTPPWPTFSSFYLAFHAVSVLPRCCFGACQFPLKIPKLHGVLAKRCQKKQLHLHENWNKPFMAERCPSGGGLKRMLAQPMLCTCGFVGVAPFYPNHGFEPYISNMVKLMHCSQYGFVRVVLIILMITIFVYGRKVYNTN